VNTAVYARLKDRGVKRGECRSLPTFDVVHEPKLPVVPEGPWSILDGKHMCRPPLVVLGEVLLDNEQETLETLLPFLVLQLVFSFIVECFGRCSERHRVAVPVEDLFGFARVSRPAQGSVGQIGEGDVLRQAVLLTEVCDLPRYVI
jgi:hypothetical protein